MFEEALSFANEVTEYFRTHDDMDFDSKLGTARMRDLVGRLSQSVPMAFVQLMSDPTVPLEERATIWAQVDDLEPQLRVRTWDQIRPWLVAEIDNGPLAGKVNVDEAFPEPPGMEAWRAQLAAEALRNQQQLDAGQGAGVERTGDR